MNSVNKKYNNSFIIFLTIAIIYAIGNFIWWQINTPIIPINNSAMHFIDILYGGLWLFYNAPLLTYIMRLMFFIFGKEHYDLIIIFINYIFFLVPLYFIYKIGVELKDKETGNIAMILFALVPAVYGMSRQYGHQDYHIIAGMTFNIYCLIKTDYFKNRKWTIWYGISVGLGLMIKDAFLAYFFIPFVYIAIVGLKEKIEKTTIINILTAIVLGCLIAGWHYFRPVIIKQIWDEPFIETIPVFIFDSLRVMTVGLWEELLSPPIFIIFIIGLIFFIWKYKGKYKNIILLWFFVPWAIIMFMPHHKLSEYGVGFIPAMILISSVFLANINRKYLKKILIELLVIIGILQYINFSYGVLNIRLFNLNLEYVNRNKNYNIEYYKTTNELIFYNKEEGHEILSFVQFIKDKYYGYKLCIIYKENLDFFCLSVQFSLNKTSHYLADLDDRILISDIIVIFGQDMTIEQIYENSIKEMEQKNKNLKEKYCVIDTFNLNNINCGRVLFLGRKDKFPQFSKL